MATPRTCGACGADNVDVDRFCRQCGRPLDDLADRLFREAPETPAPPSPPVIARPAAASGSPLPYAPTEPNRNRRSTWIIAVVAVVLVLIAVGAAVVLTGGDDEGDSEATATTESTAPTPTTAPAPPVPPTGLQVVTEGPTAIRVSWVDEADDEDHYVVARTRAESVEQIAELPAGTTSFVVDGLASNTLFCFTVAASNTADSSDPAFVEAECAVTS